MCDRNICNPHFGQRRLAIGGNGDGSKRFGCGTVAPRTFSRRKHNGLSVTDACDIRSVMVDPSSYGETHLSVCRLKRLFDAATGKLGLSECLVFRCYLDVSHGRSQIGTEDLHAHRSCLQSSA